MTAWQTGPRNAITDVPGIRVGHSTDRRNATGCTVILCESSTAAAEPGSPMLLIPDLGKRQVAEECWLAGVDSEGDPITSSFGASEGDATTLADITADISTIARDFLMSYVAARRGAGRAP